MVNFEYPLQWPQVQPRSEYSERARFGNHSVYAAGDQLIAELQRMGATDCVISSYLQVRKDGSFYSRQSRIDDPGVAVYFKLKGKDKVMACDKWDLPEHNLWALALSIEAIRGLERWGGSEFLDGLFTGFAALPAPMAMATPHQILEIPDNATLGEAEAAYRLKARTNHPDNGGSNEQMALLNDAIRKIRDSYAKKT